MKQIPVGHGLFALVDDEDYDRVSLHKWRAYRWRNTHYVQADIASRPVKLHRFILSASPGQRVDHRSGDGLDNRRSNLRPCTARQNQWNRHRSWGSSRFKGVSRDKERNCWRATIKVDGRSRQMGRFTDETAAARAYDEAARQLFGEFACLNFPA